MIRHVYLDWNATTPPHPSVLDAMRAAAEVAWANPASVHGPGRRARAFVEEAREAVATLVGLDPRDVVLTSGGTEANNLALALPFGDLADSPSQEAGSPTAAPAPNTPPTVRGTDAAARDTDASARDRGMVVRDTGTGARDTRTAARDIDPALEDVKTTGKGGERSGRRRRGAGGAAASGGAPEPPGRVRRPALILSRIEHPSVVRMAEELGRRGVLVVWIEPEPSGVVAASSFAAAIERIAGEAQPRLLVLQAVNHETGVVQPVAEVAQIAHAHGALLHVDAVQAVGRLPASTWAGADMVSVAAHKIRGPKGIGALCTRPGLKVRPLIFGGAQERGLRPGTQDPMACAGFTAAAKRAHESGPTAYEHVAALRDRLETALQELSLSRAAHPKASNPGEARGASEHGLVNGEKASIQGEARGAAKDGIVDGEKASNPGEAPDASAHGIGNSEKASIQGEARGAVGHAIVNGEGVRAPHVSNLSWPGWRGDELCAALDLEGVAVSSGSACSAGTAEPSPVIRAMLGLERATSAVRVSLGEDTTEGDVDRAIAAFRRVLARG